jgi:hypothetical protein
MTTSLKSTVALVATTAMLATGCASIGRNSSLVTSVKVAAYTGTAVGLADHPEWRRGFEEAHADLALIEQAEVIDFVFVLAVVQRLPVKELKSDKAAILITAATILLSDYGGSLPLDRLEELRPVVKAMREGIGLGLGVTWQQPATNVVSEPLLKRL